MEHVVFKKQTPIERNLVSDNTNYLPEHRILFFKTLMSNQKNFSTKLQNSERKKAYYQS